MFIYYVTPSIETKNPSYRFETVVLELVTGRTPWKNGPRVCLGFVFLGGRFSSETVSNREPFLGRKMDRFLWLDLIRQYINRHGFEQIKFINTGLYICTFVLFHPPVNSAKISIIGKERKKTKTFTFTNKLLLNSQRLCVSWEISGASQASNKPFLPTWLAVSSSEQPNQSESNSAKSSGVKLLKGSKLLKPEARRAIKDLDEWVHMSFMLYTYIYYL